MAAIVLDTGDRVMNKTDNIPALVEGTQGVEQQQEQKINVNKCHPVMINATRKVK